MLDEQQYLPTHKLRDVIDDNNMLLLVISRFDLPFGFGEMTVEDVCRSNGVDSQTFLAVANLVANKKYSEYKVDLAQLVEYLKRAHSYFIDFELPQIRHKLVSAIAGSKMSDVAFLILKYFDDYADEVKAHMEYENNVVFNHVERLCKGEDDGTFSLKAYSANHSDMTARLNELKDIIIQHYHRHDNDILNSTLYDIFNCQNDLVSHCHVENNLLVPEVARLESDIRHHRIAPPSIEVVGMTANNNFETLSNREKEIIGMVARGKSNKEIADSLCLSVNTVTTHRRNIASKLSIHSPAGLTIYAIIHHIIDLKDVKI